MFKEYESAVKELIIKERFYAEMLRFVKKEVTEKVPTAGVSITNKVNLYINKDFFIGLSISERVGVLKHEMHHILKGHIGSMGKKRFGESDKISHQLLNIATDCSINQNLPELDTIKDKVTLDSVRKMCKDDDILPNMESEYYLEKLKKAYKNGKLKTIPTNNLDDHEIWEESENNSNSNAMGEFQEALVKEVIKKAVDESKKAGQNVSKDILKDIENLFKSKVNWKQQIKAFSNSLSYHKKYSSRSKRNRRYGIIKPGKKKEMQSRIMVAIDESGSVSDELFAQFFAELEKVSEYCAKIIVVKLDVEINEVIEYEKGLKIKRTGYGGTCYGPAFRLANKLDIDGIIFFGDGDCYESELPKPKQKVLWVFPENCTRPFNFGKLVHINE